MGSDFHFRASRGGKLSVLDDGRGLVTGKSVFRTGSFRDSRGREVEVSSEDLHAMVENFYALKRSSLPHVPVRRDHTKSISNVMGYYTDLATDGNFLYADFEITEPEDVKKYERGTYRSVSIEIGKYRTNSGDEYEPTVMGLAFVDLPAVEGLFTLHQEGDNDMMTEEELDTRIQHAVAMGYAQGLEDAAPTEGDVEFALACGYAQADLDVRSEFAANDDDRPPFTFTLMSGESTTDYAAVQAELSAAAAAAEEQRSAFRGAFVDQLVTDGKIPAPMAPSLKALASTLNEEQYGTFAASYEQAPTLALFENHGDSGGGSVGGPAKDEVAKRIEVLEAQIKQHQFAGVPDEQIKSFGSWAELQSLRQTQEV